MHGESVSRITNRAPDPPLKKSVWSFPKAAQKLMCVFKEVILTQY